MAKGLLFVLVRKGSKLNYLDDTGSHCNSCNGERKSNRVRGKPRCKMNSDNTNEKETSSSVLVKQSVGPLITAEETKRRRRNLFDLTLLKLSRGGKIPRHRSSTLDNNTPTDDTYKQRHVKADCSSKPRVVASVASGYFLDQYQKKNHPSTASGKDVIIAARKQDGPAKAIPRIVLPERSSHSEKPGISKKRVNSYSRFGSFPQLRVEERSERPASWTGRRSPSSKLVPDSFVGHSTRSTSSMETNENRGLCIEATPVSALPSFQRTYLGSAGSCRPVSSELDSGLSLSGRTVLSPDGCLSVDRSVKRASSWSRGDKKDGGFCIRQNRKIDVFLPNMQ